MNVTTNDALAGRRRKQALLASMAGLSVLIVGLTANIGAMRTGSDSRYGIWIAYGALVAGSLLSWVGVVLTDRWVGRPRADEALAAGLKGAGPAYRLYNWCLPADHVLLAPWGLVVFAVFNHEGPIVIRGRRWRDARPLPRRLLAFGRRAVRDPSRLLAMETSALAHELLERDPEVGEMTIDHVVVFSSPRARVAAEEPSVPVVQVADLREWLRHEARREAMPIPARRRLERALQAIAEERLARHARGKRSD